MFVSAWETGVTSFLTEFMFKVCEGVSVVKPSDLWLVEVGENATDSTTESSVLKQTIVHRSYKIVGSVLLVMCFIGAGLWFGHSHQPKSVTPARTGHSPSAPLSEKNFVASNGITQATKRNSDLAATAGKVTVDVHGDVTHPGVVRVSANARVLDVVKACGGFLHKGDAAYVNQASVVWDGEEIDVPNATKVGVQSEFNATNQTAHTSSISVAPTATPTPTPATSHAGGRIDLNTADVSTLETLPGVGPARAKAIVDYRTMHGPFPSVQTLLQIRGIGAKTLSKWREHLFVLHDVSHVQSKS